MPIFIIVGFNPMLSQLRRQPNVRRKPREARVTISSIGLSQINHDVFQGCTNCHVQNTHVDHILTKVLRLGPTIGIGRKL